MTVWINDHPIYNPDLPLHNSKNSFRFSQQVVNPEEVSWKEFAHILYAEKIYRGLVHLTYEKRKDKLWK